MRATILVNEHEIADGGREPSAEEVSLLLKWNSDRGVPSEAVNNCIHELVDKQVLLRPHALAVHAWDGQLTYEQLDELAERLTHHLINDEYAVGPESKVLLCFDKSMWAIVAMLAILKAGAVVVPLGTINPVPRLAQIAKDTEATLMLVGPQYASRVAGLVPHVLTVDGSLLGRLPVPTAKAAAKVTARNAAYIIYTSGSTGVPKGVVLEHSALCTSSQAHGRAFGLGPDTRAVQFADYAYDVSLADIWFTLHHGGCICVMSEQDRMDNIVGAIGVLDGNTINLTPTVAMLLDPAKAPKLRTLILAGENCHASIIEAWSNRVALYNSYGPSEASFGVTVNGPVVDSRAAGNIGRPVAGSLWIVDAADYNRLCPIGVPGEILIEGPLLARGYLNDSAKTASAFIMDPTWAAQYGLGHGRRMYRTGDMARQNHDGSLTYLGRMDNQIKVHGGRRVELGEIEHWIRVSHPDVRAVAVDAITPREDEATPVLTAFVEFDKDSVHVPGTNVSTPGPCPMSEGMRDKFSNLQMSLLNALPPYMVPALYIPMAQLPQTASGKLDRKLIRHLFANFTREELLKFTLANSAKAAPTDLERRLQGFWADVLGLGADSIGTQDNFFQLGGDSIAAMRLVSMARANGLDL
ncbi:acetyl-CoA synthetase-like protein, partial [Rhizodiscina lignyota]